MSPRTGRFEAAARLRRSADFQRVTRSGRRASSNEFVVLCARRAGDAVLGEPCRLGITVSRKVGNAVVRNRMKRRIREWFRADREPLGSGVDVLVIGRAAATKLPHAAFRAELSRLSNTACTGARRGNAQ
jgi:ribonuclease P protein component